MEAEEQILAGELLERLGNKKSKFIIQLIADYIQANPSVMDKDNTIKSIISSNTNPFEDMIKDLIRIEIEKGRIVVPQSTEVVPIIDIEQSNSDGVGVAAMLNNLDAWN